MDYCGLARQSLGHWLEHRTLMLTSQKVGRSAGCFVSLHTAGGDLRGCVGTISPVRADLCQEILENAVTAGTRDNRFPAVTLKELPSLVFEVSILSEPELIVDKSELDPKRYGVIVECNHRRGVLLPDLEGIDSVMQQLTIAKRKAGIAAHEQVKMWRFLVEKFLELHS